MEGWHRNVFSWPSEAWIHRDKSEVRSLSKDSFSAADLGVELTEADHGTELKRAINQAIDDGRDEPLCVFDMNTVISKYHHWVKCFPRIRPHFAVKVYDDPTVISLLDHLGAGFDCASKTEIELVVKKLNVNPNNVIYANAIKAPSHLATATNNGVTLMTFDCEEELKKVKRLSPKARLVMRLSPVQTGDAEWPLSKKFGCDKKDVPRLFQLARSLELKVVGVCFHAGSGIDAARPYVCNIKEARDAFDVGQREGFRLNLLDIGGGFYGDEGAEGKLEKMSGPIMEAIDEYFPEKTGVTIIAEPGRYFVESGLKLGACIIGKKAVSEDEKRRKTDESHQNTKGIINKCHDKDPNRGADFSYYISASVFGILSDSVYFGNSDYHPTPYKRTQRGESEQHVSVLWGPSCDSIDKIQRNSAMPELHQGDWLIFHDVGAYTISVSTTFNGFQPCERIVRIMHPAIWDSFLDRSSLIENNPQ